MSLHHPSVQHQGSALVFALLLLTILTVLAMAMHRAALAEAQIAGSIANQQQAFALAMQQIAAGLLLAQTQPENLPTSIAMPLSRISQGAAHADAVIESIGQDSHCSGLTAGERIHYQITSTAQANRGARSQLVQGFWLCRELCTPPCTAVMYAPHRSYWYMRQ